MNEPFFELTTGPAKYGGCDFTVRVGAESWRCRASYIGLHPLYDLIHSVIDLYEHFFRAPYEEDVAIWDCLAQDEPGGILLRVVPDEDRCRCLRVRFFKRIFDDFPKNPDSDPENLPVADFSIGYWDYAEAVYRDAARALKRQGFMGLRNGWLMNRWDADSHYEALPIEHFLYLAALVRNRKPVENPDFAAEIALLRDIEGNRS